jgi:hypothetical protein
MGDGCSPQDPLRFPCGCDLLRLPDEGLRLTNSMSCAAGAGICRPI